MSQTAWYTSGIFLLLLLKHTESACFTPRTENPWDTPEPGPRNLTYCNHYNKLTCCTQSKAQNVDFSSEPCGAPSQSCLDSWNMYLCRFCSPRYSTYVNYWGKLKVCSDFADRLYSACKSSKIQFITEQSASCVLIGEKWTSAKDFVVNVFDNEYSLDDPADGTCFNAAPTVRVFTTVVAAALFLVFLI